MSRPHQPSGARPLAGRGQDYAEVSGSGSRSVFWSGISVAGRQGLLLAFSLLLARLLGPDAYGVLAQAGIFVSLSTLLMDQGMTAALINAKEITSRQIGAAAGLNLAMGSLLALVALAVARPAAAFFTSPQLAGVLAVLGLGLVVKAVAIVPRMMLIRVFDFRTQAIVDVVGTTVGGLVGVVGALAGTGAWALVTQIVVTDLLIGVGLTVAARPPLANTRWGELRSSMGFSSRVLVSNFVSFAVQNLDTVLIGRSMSTQSLACYSLAYRVLTTPTQLVGQVVTRVLFPAITRARYRGGDVAVLVARSIRTISLLTFPAMALVASGASVAVPLFLGAQWTPAVPVLVVFAVGGARASVTTVNTSVMMGMGRADVALRFSLAAAVTQVAGIILGLHGGIVGVALGFTAAGFVLTPVIGGIQKRLTGFSYRRQLGAVLPALHATAWLLVAYHLAVLAIGQGVTAFVTGTLVGLIAYVLVLRLVHRSTWQAVAGDARRVFGR